MCSGLSCQCYTERARIAERATAAATVEKKQFSTQKILTMSFVSKLFLNRKATLVLLFVLLLGMISYVVSQEEVEMEEVRT